MYKVCCCILFLLIIYLLFENSCSCNCHHNKKINEKYETELNNDYYNNYDNYENYENYDNYESFDNFSLNSLDNGLYENFAQINDKKKARPSVGMNKNENPEQVKQKKSKSK